MIRIPTNREPTHPGVILREEYLQPMEITQRALAVGIHVPCQRINELMNGKHRAQGRETHQLEKIKPHVISVEGK